MKVIARTPGSEAFAIQLSDNEMRVLDIRRRRLFPPEEPAAILSRGSWLEFAGDPAPILDLAEALLGDGTA